MRVIHIISFVSAVFVITSCRPQNNENNNSGIKQTKPVEKQAADQKEAKSNYLGEVPPGLSPKIFAPGIVSTKDNFEFKIAFTPDGKEIYFTQGVGMGSEIRQILFTRQTDSGWTNPKATSFCGSYMDEYPAISLDGKKLFFNSNRPLPVSWNKRSASYIFNLWVTERENENWGEPYPINTEANKGYCINYIDKSGAIYFNSSKYKHIAKSTFEKGKYSEPIELDTQIKSTECFFAQDNSYVIFSSDSPGFGKLDLFVSFISEDGVWSKPINLGKRINTSQSESAPVISPDGKYFFFNRGGDIYWVDAGFIEKYKLEELK